MRSAESIAATNRILQQIYKAQQRRRVVLKKQIAGSTTLASPGSLFAQPQRPNPKLTITRYQDADLRVYQVSSNINVEEPLEPVSTFNIQSNDEIADCTVGLNLRRAVYATRNKVVCIGQESTVLWSRDLEPLSTRFYGHRPGCAFFLDGTKLWVYRPDAMAGRYRLDTLEVLDADTGEVVDKADLDTVGHGANLMQHPDGQHLLIGIGEGQDGAKIFRAALTDDGIELHLYEWTDRCLVDLAPDGRLFITIHHGWRDVACHRFPDGDVVLRLPVVDFGYRDDAATDWSGGFLSPQVAVIAVVGETDGQEWRHYHRVDLLTGQPMGRFEPNCPEGSDFELLGDGSWITSTFDGNLVRWHAS